MFKSKKIILVTGTPAVGKSRVARILSQRLLAKYIDLTNFIKKHDVSSSYDKISDSRVVDESEVKVKLMKYIEESEDETFIVDGHFAVFAIHPELIYKVFVLRRHPQELKSVLQERSYDERKIRENLASEILDVCLVDAINACGIDKVCEVDATSKETDQVVNEIIELLSGEKKCKVGIVDWLGELEKSKRLSEFLNF